MRVIDELRNITVGATEIGMEAVDKYKGEPLSDCFNMVDDLEEMLTVDETATDMIIGMESMIGAVAFRNEDGEVEIKGQSIGLEGMAETVKASGYKAKAFAKRLIATVIKFVKSVILKLRTSDAKLKSFGKVTKKYREKLVTARAEEKSSDKEYSIRTCKFEDLIKEVKEMNNVDLKSHITPLKSGAPDWQSFFNLVTGSIKDVTGLKDDNIKDIEAIETTIKDKVINENMEDIIEGFEIEKEDMSFTDAKTYLLKESKIVEAACKKDVKVQKDLARLVEALETGLEKTMKAEERGVVGGDTYKQNAMVSKMGILITHTQLAQTKLFKHCASALQSLITDMAKVTAAAKAK